MSAPPKTVLHATEDEEKAIRAAVREARGLDTIGGALVRPTDACEFSEFLADPAVSDPIYDLPRPFTEAIVRAWIEERVERRMSGEALLSLTRDANGRILSFANVDVWPARSSAELAGAMRVDQQNSGRGGAGALRVLGWIFEQLGVRLICLTAAKDNIRSSRLIDAAGFVRMGERDCMRRDGSTRPSFYWEMTRMQWRAHWAQTQGG